jgi:hypothetical protein
MRDGRCRTWELLACLLGYFTFEMLALRRAGPAYKHLTARICRQILAELFDIFNVEQL